MSGDESVKSVQDEAQKALVNVIRTATVIGGEDIEFFRASDPAGGKKLEKQSARLLDIAKRLIKSATSGTDVSTPRLKNYEAVDDNWQGVVEVVDSLLEKADIALDEYTGVVRKLTPGQEQQAQVVPPSTTSARRSHFGPKPQLQFDKPPTNDEVTAFKPLLTSKPNAIVPLEESLDTSISEIDTLKYQHPYQVEIDRYHYPSRVLEHAEPIPFKPLQGEATFVDTPEAVAEMLKSLKGAKEIAIDLEHHDRHSYIGLVSLMQISTRDQDWIVDTLKPWRESLQVLNEVFTDPNIVKVLHGSHMDIIWLQRDLGLYIVGLFDTFHAASALHYPKRSLASLLSNLAGFEAQKAYQTADWRIRPLPKEFLDYARSDTHFLLYIYDILRNELIQSSDGTQQGGHLLQEVLESSKKECLQTFERPIYDAERGTGPYGWYNILIKAHAPFDKQQFAVFRAIHRWRDDLARKEDESVFSIMQNNVLLSIARQMPLNGTDLLSYVSPISDAIRHHAQELVKIIKDAKASGLNGPEMREVMKTHPLNIAYEKRKAERILAKPSTGPSLAEIVRQEKAKQPPQDVEVGAVIGRASSFWGPTVHVRNPPGTKGVIEPPRTAELRLQVPLPPFTAEVYASSDNGAVKSTPSAPLPEHEYTKKDKRSNGDEVVVLREMSRKSKRKAGSLDNGDREGPEPEEATEPTNMDAVGGEDIVPLTEEKQGTKAERKAQRKAEKARRKEEEARAKEREKLEEPFDYANAPSVLNHKPGKAEKAKKSKPAFNPYAKLADAPKGMRKKQKEIQGKTATFKK